MLGQIVRELEPHVSHTGKDESLCWIKAHRDNVFDILGC